MFQHKLHKKGEVLILHIKMYYKDTYKDLCAHYLSCSTCHESKTIYDEDLGAFNASQSVEKSVMEIKH